MGHGQKISRPVKTLARRTARGGLYGSACATFFRVGQSVEPHRQQQRRVRGGNPARSAASRRQTTTSMETRCIRRRGREATLSEGLARGFERFSIGTVCGTSRTTRTPKPWPGAGFCQRCARPINRRRDHVYRQLATARLAAPLPSGNRQNTTHPGLLSAARGTTLEEPQSDEAGLKGPSDPL